MQKPSWKRGAEAMGEASRLIHVFMLDPNKAETYRKHVQSVEFKLVDDPHSEGGAHIEVQVVASQQTSSSHEVGHRLTRVSMFPAGEAGTWGRKLAATVEEMANEALGFVGRGLRSERHAHAHDMHAT
jgi:hypothetical protein